MNDSARKAANLKLLKRTCDPNIQDILATSTHVVLYEFTGTCWTKMGVEGSIFLTVTSNNASDCIILNRSTPKNFTLSVTRDLQLQHQPPYLIVKVPATSKVLGIWFPSTEEQQAFYNGLQQTVERLRSNPLPPVAAAAPEVPAQLPPANIDHEATALLTSKLLMNVAINAADSSDVAEPVVLSSPPPPANNASASTQTSMASPPAPTPPRHGSPAGTGVALDKKSLQLALLSLIQDDRFLDLLHSQYLRVMHSRAKSKREGDKS